MFSKSVDAKSPEQGHANYGEVFMSGILSKMGTFLTSPEEEIFKQGEDSHELIYIIHGDCVLNITEHDLKTRTAVKLMVEGDHIGEIGLLYKCKRTASVISRNYNVMARLSSGNFRELSVEYP